VTATAAIDELIERGLRIARRLDAIIRNKFRDDPARLAAWTSAHHVERAARRKQEKQPAPPPVAPTLIRALFTLNDRTALDFKAEGC
jgi:hypothetical protein